MRITICGPNLRDQSKGQFHAHAEGCKDLVRGARGPEPEYANGWTIEADTKVEVGDSVYEDHISEGTMLSGEGVDDVQFFSCCASLPYGSPAPTVTAGELRSVADALEELGRGGDVIDIDDLEAALHEAASIVRTAAAAREAARG
jgi:hypothetical protein